MPTTASTAMHVIDVWKPELPDTHTLVINRTVALSPELNHRIAVIGNGNRFLCYASTPKQGYTAIEVAITDVDNRRLSVCKLRDIIFEIAEALGVPGNQIILELKGRMAPVRLQVVNNLIGLTGADNTLDPDESNRDRTARLRRERSIRYAEEARARALRAKSA